MVRRWRQAETGGARSGEAAAWQGRGAMQRMRTEETGESLRIAGPGKRLVESLERRQLRSRWCLKMFEAEALARGASRLTVRHHSVLWSFTKRRRRSFSFLLREFVWNQASLLFYSWVVFKPIGCQTHSQPPKSPSQMYSLRACAYQAELHPCRSNCLEASLI